MSLQRKRQPRLLQAKGRAPDLKPRTQPRGASRKDVRSRLALLSFWAEMIKRLVKLDIGPLSFACMAVVIFTCRRLLLQASSRRADESGGFVMSSKKGGFLSGLSLVIPLDFNEQALEAMRDTVSMHHKGLKHP